MRLFFSITFLLLCQGPIFAQFHQKEGSTGQPEMRKMNNPYNGPATPSSMSGVPNLNQRVIQSTPAFVMATNLSAEKAGSHVKIEFQPRRMNKETKFWGRAENHPDGTYTETVFDDNTEKIENLVVQHTRRKSMTGDDTLIQTRQISLNSSGLPDEVLIMDASGKPKYRGKFLYDPMGRILEEQLRDINGTPLRRTVQKYSPTNEPLPLETYDYVKNLPKELKLIVTPTDQVILDQLAEINTQLIEAEKKGKFNNLKKKKLEADAREIQENFDRKNSAPPQQTAEVTASAAPVTQPSKITEETGGKKFQLFRKKPPQ